MSNLGEEVEEWLQDVFKYSSMDKYMLTLLDGHTITLYASSFLISPESIMFFAEEDFESECIAVVPMASLSFFIKVE